MVAYHAPFSLDVNIFQDGGIIEFQDKSLKKIADFFGP